MSGQAAARNTPLFADTKTAEYLPEQIIAADLAGDFAQENCALLGLRQRVRKRESWSAYPRLAPRSSWRDPAHQDGGAAADRAPESPRGNPRCFSRCARNRSRPAPVLALKNLRRIAQFIDARLHAAKIDFVEDQCDRNALRQLFEFRGQG